MGVRSTETFESRPCCPSSNLMPENYNIWCNSVKVTKTHGMDFWSGVLCWLSVWTVMGQTCASAVKHLASQKSWLRLETWSTTSLNDTGETTWECLLHITPLWPPLGSSMSSVKRLNGYVHYRKWSETLQTKVSSWKKKLGVKMCCECSDTISRMRISQPFIELCVSTVNMDDNMKPRPVWLFSLSVLELSVIPTVVISL